MSKKLDKILETLRLNVELNLQDRVSHETPERIAEAKQAIIEAVEGLVGKTHQILKDGERSNCDSCTDCMVRKDILQAIKEWQ